MNNDRPDRLTPDQEHMLVAFKERLQRHIVWYASDGIGHAFSGTALSVDGANFLVTAGHCISDIKDPESLRMMTFAHQSPGIPVHGKGWYRYTKEQDSLESHGLLDLAIAPLSDSLLEKCGVEPLDVTHLSTTGLQAGHRVIVAGFPRDLFEHTGSNSKRIHAKPVVGHSVIADAASFAELNWDHPIDENGDLFVPFELEPQIIDGTRLVPGPSFEPHGMSGCGVFAPTHVEEGDVWRPEVFLVGIQSSWHRNGGAPVLRVKRIEMVAGLLRAALEVEAEDPEEESNHS